MARGKSEQYCSHDEAAKQAAYPGVPVPEESIHEATEISHTKKPKSSRKF
jgi:hypothetical protein